LIEREKNDKYSSEKKLFYFSPFFSFSQWEKKGCRMYEGTKQQTYRKRQT